MLSRSGKKEGIDFKHNKWIYFIVLAAVLGAISGLYDKYLMAPPENGGVGLDRMIVQSWYNIYQCFLIGAMLLMIWWPTKKNSTPFHWHWSIIFMSIFLSAADFVYFFALSLPGAMISIVSMIRRGSVIVSFLFGAAIFHEKNLKAKFVDLLLVLLGMLFLLLRNEVMIIKKSCKPMCLQDFFMFLPDMCTLVLRNKELVALLDVECLIP